MMNRLSSISRYIPILFFSFLVQLRYAMGQAEEGGADEYPLNPSPFRLIFYIVISFIVIAVVFKLLYKPKNKRKS
ncbi:hypothetical protein SAMN04488057_103248 [Cyclobacterium lianum]|uniref:Uncharacterized protein n=1 Tax=Cyclobacterium lianum TaxID=388280 RepID=A0A1M7LE92_9BACT|nr:hypothetical protein [Cyclobacterium lianum]SHM76435.1 hypothetical protein SAMN04488057_103248 [Cyclobacterium lianum]